MAKKEGVPKKEREVVVRPNCYVREEPDGRITVKVELPGVPAQDVQINVEGNQLQVSGNRQLEAGGGQYLLRERRGGLFRQVFTLDDTIDPDKIDARQSAGVLTLTLHRKEAAKPRKITVKAG